MMKAAMLSVRRLLLFVRAPRVCMAGAAFRGKGRQEDAG